MSTNGRPSRVGAALARPSSCPRPSARRARGAARDVRAHAQRRDGTRRGCARTRRASRRRTCAAPPPASTSATIVSPTTPGRRHRGDVGALLERDRLFLGLDVDGLQHRPVERRQRLHRDARDEQVAGRHAAFDAAGARATRAVRRRSSASQRISSCASLPRRAGDVEAVADLDAPSSPGCSSAPARAARRCGGPSARASRGRAARRSRAPRRTPPSESPAFAAASISAIIAASASGSKQRTGDSSTAVEVGGRRAGAPSAARRRAHLDDVAEHRDAELRRAAPWPARRPRPAPRSRARCARSSTSRASSKPYFCMPTRSAWPGRGWRQRLLGDARAPATSPPATSATRCCGSRSTTGEPSVRAVAHAAEELDVVALEAHARARGRSRGGAARARRRSRRR